jgi:pyruvate dehydrogenase E2 component (dihydrolipoamide acetyltransferase)
VFSVIHVLWSGLVGKESKVRVEVKLPDLGEDAPDEATVSFFFVDEGDDVKEGDDLVEMVTDKATFEVPAPAAGKVVEIKAEEEQIIKVGQVLAVIDTEG